MARPLLCDGVMKIANLGMALLLSAIPAAAYAQPVDYDDTDDQGDYDAPPVDPNVDPNLDPNGDGADVAQGVQGESVADVDVFVDQLSPYGTWADEPALGNVFIPQTASYVPYTNGHWQYTDVGF